jgi:hypothetical protein|tara:strand:- start:3247 stop:3435 length:189 start_codon:yes stop_codon:yes gene_type:complete
MAEKNVESVEQLDNSIEVKDNKRRDLVSEGRREANIRAGYSLTIFDIAEDLGLDFNAFEGEK